MKMARAEMAQQREEMGKQREQAEVSAVAQQALAKATALSAGINAFTAAIEDVNTSFQLDLQDLTRLRGVGYLSPINHLSGHEFNNREELMGACESRMAYRKKSRDSLMKDLAILTNESAGIHNVPVSMFINQHSNPSPTTPD